MYEQYIMASKKTVLVTGFEPFGEHTVNSSWVAVQELERLGLGEGIDLHVCEVPVEYQAVQSLLPSLWKRHQPQLVVHVGVSGIATTVTLEQCGHNHGYKRVDNCAFCPDSQCCMEDGPDCIVSVLDMDLICKRLNSSGLGVAVSVSKDAGRYLCDYTYYTSLYLGQGRSAFVHVPPLGKPFSSQDLGRALQAALLVMVELLDQAEEDHKHHGNQDEEDHKHHGNQDEEDHKHHGNQDEEDHKHHGNQDEEDHKHHGNQAKEDHKHHGNQDEEDHKHHGNCHHSNRHNQHPH